LFGDPVRIWNMKAAIWYVNPSIHVHYQSMSRIFCLAFFVIVASCVAQEDLSGKRQYPQFRTASGLAGSSLTVSKDGKVGGLGVISLSIPTAFSLGRDTWMIGGAYTSDGFGVRVPSLNAEKEARGNGTAWLAGGMEGNWGRATLSVMALSSKFDNVFNGQLTPRTRLRDWEFALGVQDIIGDGGSGGEAIDSRGGGNSRSCFAVATWTACKNTYVSGGWGSNRFRFGFLGLSHNVSDRLTFEVEHDGYNFNGLASYNLGSIGRVGSRTATGAVSAGLVRGKYLYLSLVFGF